MPRYRASYVDAVGKAKVDWLEGPSARWVFLRLERSGARQVSVMEDFLASGGRDLAAEARYEEERAADRRGIGSPGTAASDVGAYLDSHLARPAAKSHVTPLRAMWGWTWPSALFALGAWMTQPAPGAPSRGFRILALLAVSLPV